MTNVGFDSIKLGVRPPVRIARPGTFPVLGMPGCTYTVGHDAVMDFDWQRMPDSVGVDIETAGFKGRKKYDIKSVQIASTTHCLVLDPRDPPQRALAYKILNSGRRLVLHNSPFDAPPLYLTGMIELDTCYLIDDTLIWARGADPSDKGGKELFRVLHRYLGIGDGKDALAAMLKPMRMSKAVWFENHDLNTPVYLAGAVVDTIGTARLAPIVRRAFYDRLTTGHRFGARAVSGDEAWRLVDREQVLNRPRVRRQCIGLLYDPDYLDKWRADNAVDVANMEKEIVAAGVKPTDSGSLVEALNKKDLLPKWYPRTKKTRKPSGDKKNLEKLGHPLVAAFLKHKNLDHLDKDYLSKVHDSADDNGRIHPGTGFLAAVTGRASIGGDAPLQQFSGASRGILLADDWEEARRTIEHPVLVDTGKGEMEAPPCTCTDPRGLGSNDWSQIEPVVMANVAGDTTALAFYEGGAKFYHALIAAAEQAGVSLAYKHSKIVLLAQMYGEAMRNVASKNNWSAGESQALVDAVWAALPGSKDLVHAWDKDLGKEGLLREITREHGMMMTISGRIIPVPLEPFRCWTCEGTGHVDPEDDESAVCHKCGGRGANMTRPVHKGVNYFIQGSAYDVLAEAEYAIWEAGLAESVYFSMHDELVFDARARHEIVKIMGTPPERLCMWAKRLDKPVLRTDFAHLGERWSNA